MQARTLSARSRAQLPRPVLRNATFLAALAALLLVCPAVPATAADSPKEDAGVRGTAAASRANDHWPFVHSTFCAGGVLRPAELLADPAFEAFRRGFEAEAGTTNRPALAERLLKAGPQLSRVWGYLDSEPTDEYFVGFLVVLRFRRPASLDQAAELLGLRFGEPTKLAGREIRRIQTPEGWRGGTLAAHAVGPDTILLGSESVVAQQLTVPGKPGPLVEALCAAPFPATAGGTMLIRPSQKFWKYQQRRIPDRAATLAQSFLDLAPQAELLRGSIDLRGQALFEGEARFADGDSADALRRELAGLWGAAKLTPIPTAEQAAAKRIDQLMAAWRELKGTSPIHASNGTVSVSIRAPSNLAAAAEQAGRAAGRAHAKGK